MSKIEDFKLVSRLGEGSYSSVYKGIRLSDNQVYAIKKVKMGSLNEKEKENALNEVRILASINDPYIVGYNEAFFDLESNCLFVVMEYATGGDLQKKLKEHITKKLHIKEEEIWRCLIYMTCGLKTLHDMKILHRDLKCANIFLNEDGTMKLGDLNVSKVAKKGLVYTQTGTPYYASPEVWRDEPYDSKSDIWSLGCVLYELAAQNPPFRAEDMKNLFKKVQKGNFDRIPKVYSNELQIIISKCLQVNPASRPSCKDLLKNAEVIERSRQYKIDLPSLEIDHSPGELLKTIVLPKNLNLLKNNLPLPNYKSNSRSEENFIENFDIRTKKTNSNARIQSAHSGNAVGYNTNQENVRNQAQSNYSPTYNQRYNSAHQSNKANVISAQIQLDNRVLSQAPETKILNQNQEARVLSQAKEKNLNQGSESRILNQGPDTRILKQVPETKNQYQSQEMVYQAPETRNMYQAPETRNMYQAPETRNMYQAPDTRIMYQAPDTKTNQTPQEAKRQNQGLETKGLNQGQQGAPQQIQKQVGGVLLGQYVFSAQPNQMDQYLPQSNLNYQVEGQFKNEEQGQSINYLHRHYVKTKTPSNEFVGLDDVTRIREIKSNNNSNHYGGASETHVVNNNSNNNSNGSGVPSYINQRIEAKPARIMSAQPAMERPESKNSKERDMPRILNDIGLSDSIDMALKQVQEERYLIKGQLKYQKEMPIIQEPKDICKEDNKRILKRSSMASQENNNNPIYRGTNKLGLVQSSSKPELKVLERQNKQELTSSKPLSSKLDTLQANQNSGAMKGTQGMNYKIPSSINKKLEKGTEEAIDEKNLIEYYAAINSRQGDSNPKRQAVKEVMESQIQASDQIFEEINEAEYQRFENDISNAIKLGKVSNMNGYTHNNSLRRPLYMRKPISAQNANRIPILQKNTPDMLSKNNVRLVSAGERALLQSRKVDISYQKNQNNLVAIKILNSNLKGTQSQKKNCSERLPSLNRQTLDVTSKPKDNEGTIKQIPSEYEKYLAQRKGPEITRDSERFTKAGLNNNELSEYKKVELKNYESAGVEPKILKRNGLAPVQIRRPYSGIESYSNNNAGPINGYTRKELGQPFSYVSNNNVSNPQSNNKSSPLDSFVASPVIIDGRTMMNNKPKRILTGTPLGTANMGKPGPSDRYMGMKNDEVFSRNDNHLNRTKLLPNTLANK